MKSTSDRNSPATIESPTSPPESETYPPSGYAWYVVAVLTLAYIVSFIDRQILSLLVDPIRNDLGIGEKQMSLLMGASFAVFYTFFGIPLGWLADTRSRRGVIAAGIALWSAMTAGCGLTKRFWQLALMRMGVGVGEASLSPAAYSLISDYFRPGLRSTAMSVYSMGIYLGSGLALIVGGLVIRYAAGQASAVLPWVGTVHPWQLVFLLVGLPGLLVRLLLLTIREPERQGVRRSEDGSTGVPRVSLSELWHYVRDNRATFLYLNLGIALLTLEGYGRFNWIPSLFIRRHGWTQGTTGLVFGSIVAVSGTLGIVTGGRLADGLRCAARPTPICASPCWAGLGWLPFGLLFPVVPSAFWAATLLTPAVFFMSMPFGVAPAAIQQMMPNTMRAQATALYLFAINLIGMGLGPTLVAALTEDVFRDKTAVGLSLLIVGVAAHLGGAVLLWLGLESLPPQPGLLEAMEQHGLLERLYPARGEMRRSGKGGRASVRAGGDRRRLGLSLALPKWLNPDHARYNSWMKIDGRSRLLQSDVRPAGSPYGGGALSPDRVPLERYAISRRRRGTNDSLTLEEKPMGSVSSYPSLVTIIRHGEKPGDPADDSSGGPHLSILGSARAAALPSLFTPDPNATPIKKVTQVSCDVKSGKTGRFTGKFKSTKEKAGATLFPVPDFLFAAQSTTSSHRPVETITPLSQALNLTINTPYSDNAYTQQAQEILDAPEVYGGKVVLICWHHGKAPDLAQAFGVSKKDLKPWSPWQPTVFDLIFQITWPTSTTVNFVVSYQQLLFGDTPSTGGSSS